MIGRVIEFSAKNRFLVFLLVIVTAIGSWFALKNIPLDAIPDLSDTQVIVFSKWNRPPGIIEDQVTYPIISAMLGAPRVKDIRGISVFGYSFVYIVFKDGTDPYWARSRILEYLSQISPQLPKGVQTELGPDATGLGWVYQYALVDKSGRHSLADLRTFQDWYLKYYLESIPGVAEVASVGGYQKEYQVKLNPNSLLAYHVSLQDVLKAIHDGNNEIGAGVMEVSGAEYMIRGLGYVRNVRDIGNIVVAYRNRTPIYIKNVGTITVGPAMRRGVADLDGKGDTVGGIVIMRYGANANNVIQAVKQRLQELEPSFPKGVQLVTTYDRSDLIHRAIHTLKHELTIEMIIVGLVILIFLLHIPSAAVPITMLPLAVLMSFIPMYFMGVTSNIMSLGGIAIAIGAMVDAAIVVVENTHKHKEIWEKNGRTSNLTDVIITAVKEVGPASFYSLLVIAVAFLPIFALRGEEGRLFKPLAYTKNFAMLAAAILSVTLVPALMVTLGHIKQLEFRPRWLSRAYNRIFNGKTLSEDEHPISRFIFRVYGPIVRWAVDHRHQVLFSALLVLLLTIPVYLKLGSEFMPPLNEGTILYMPTTLPGISISAAQDLLQRQDQALMTFPEVQRVFGQAGRASTATDSAPLSMMDTIVLIKPQSEWPRIDRWYSFLPHILQWPWNLIEPDHISWSAMLAQMNKKMQFPGATNSWTMPIRNRIDMLTTGIRTPIGVKVLGSNLKQIQKVAIQVQSLLQNLKGTRSVYAERPSGGYYLDFKFNRTALARYGISISQAQRTLMAAVGGESVSTAIEGRERFPINVRYFQDYRQNINALKHVLIATPSGSQIPMGSVAKLEMESGPDMIRNDDGMLSTYVYIDISGTDMGHYVQSAKNLLRKKLTLPTGVALIWSGQYQNMERVRKTLKVILPLTLLLIVLLLFANTKSWIKTFIVLLAVPFSAVGAVWLLYLLGYNLSIAVWVGLIALLGVDAETGVFMLLFLDLAYQEALKQNQMNSFSDLKNAIYNGAVKRARPKVMTVACLLMALLPVMWMSSAHAGADVMKRIAAPMLGGIITSFVLELLVYPAIFAVWKKP